MIATQGRGGHHSGCHQFPAANGSILYFYGYSREGQRLWLLSDLISGKISLGQTVSFKVHDAAGGTFSQPKPSADALLDWGSGTLRLDDCGRGEIVLDGVDGQKTSRITKLAGIVAAVCPA